MRSYFTPKAQIPNSVQSPCSAPPPDSTPDTFVPYDSDIEEHDPISDSILTERESPLGLNESDSEPEPLPRESMLSAAQESSDESARSDTVSISSQP
jgi:hypothetical protein